MFHKKYLKFAGLFFVFWTSALLAKENTEKNEFYSTESMEIETRFIVNAMEKLHYNRFPINQLDGKKFIEYYMSNIDANHLFFYQPQVSEFCLRFAESIGLYLKQGNLYPAFEIFKTFKSNVHKRTTWIFERLKEPFDFTQKGTFKVDRHEAFWPVNREEGDSIWEARLKYELINEILSEFYSDAKEEQSLDITDPATFEKYLAKAQATITKRYQTVLKTVNEMESVEVEEVYLSSFMQLSDPHSAFMSTDTMEDLAMQLHNSMVGIGATLVAEDGYIVIRDLVAGGPAEKSQALKPKDIILAVKDDNGEYVDIFGMKLKKAIKFIRGKEGTYAHLLIRPAEDPSTKKEIKILRGEVKLTYNLASAEIFEVPMRNKTCKIGLIDLPSFYGPSVSNSDEPSTTKDVQELIKKLQAAGVEGIVLDLRYNGGGLLPEAITLTGLFVPIGPVLNVRDSTGAIREYLDTDPSVAWKGPLMVLVSRLSASASEIFAGALKSYNRAIIVGDKSTHGKGTVQVVMDVERPLIKSLFKRNLKLGSLRLTFQKWYLPDGNSTQLKGVEADIHIPSIYEYIPVAESDLKNPLPWDSIHSLPWNYAMKLKDYSDYVDAATLEKLSQLSQLRQRTLDEFAFLNKSINYFQQKQEQKEYSTNLLERKTQRDQDKIVREVLEKELKQLVKDKFVSEKIYLDVAQKQVSSLIPSKPVGYFDPSEPSVKDAKNKDKEKVEGDKADEPLPSFDIHVREALRIMADYIELEKSAEAVRESKKAA